MNLFGNFFRSKVQPVMADFTLIGADMHSHLIPGIDDGCKTIEESVSLVRFMFELGYKKLITTPHIMTDYYKNSHESIYRGLDRLREAVANANIPVVIEAAAEYMYDGGFIDKIKQGNFLTFGNNYLLIELSPYLPPEKFYNAIFELRTNGINPVLAHPERYFYWHDTPDVFESLRDREILLQINLPSLSGIYSPQVKKVAEMLIDKNLIDFIGTDLHNEKYFELILNAQKSKHLVKLLQSPVLRNNYLL